MPGKLSICSSNTYHPFHTVPNRRICILLMDGGHKISRSSLFSIYEVGFFLSRAI